MTLPHAADPGGRNRQAALLQCLRHPHLAPGRLSGKGRELGMEPRHWSRRRSAAPARPVEPPQPGIESSLDSLLEGTGFEPPVPHEAFSVVVAPVAFAPNFALPGNRAEVR